MSRPARLRAGEAAARALGVGARPWLDLGELFTWFVVSHRGTILRGSPQRSDRPSRCVYEIRFLPVILGLYLCNADWNSHLVES